MANFSDGISDALKNGKDATFFHEYDNEDIGIQDTDAKVMDSGCGRPSSVIRRSSGGQGARALLQHQEPGRPAIEQYQQRQYSSPALGIEQYQQRQCPPLYPGYGNFAVDSSVQPPFLGGYSDPRAKEMDKRVTHDNRTFIALHKSEEAVVDVLKELDLNAELNDMRGRMSLRHIVPLPIELSVNVSMPFGRLPKSMRKVVREVSAHLEVGEDATLLALLGVIFVSCRGNFMIEVKKGYREALTEYLLVVMPSGSRKSAIIGFFRKFIEDVEKELQQAYRENAFKNKSRLRLLKKVKSKKESEFLKDFGESGWDGIDECAEQLAVQLKLIDQEIQNISTCPRFFVDTPTPKALAMVAQAQGEAIAVCEAEGGVFKHRLRASNDDIFLKGYNMEPFGDEISTGKNVFMEKPCITICSFVQSSVADKVYSNKLLKDDGFVPRILPAFLPIISSYNRVSLDISEDVIELCSTKIKSLLMLARPEGEIGERTYHTIKLSPEAQRIHREYVQRNRAGLLLGSCHGFEPFVEKLAGHAIRLAGAIHVWEHDVPQEHEINGQSMQGGIDLAEYFLQHVSGAYDENRVKALTFAKKILRWMNSHRKPKFTERDAHRGVGHCTIGDIRRGLELLERHNYIERRVDVKTTHCVVSPHYSFDHNQL